MGPITQFDPNWLTCNNCRRSKGFCSGRIYELQGSTANVACFAIGCRGGTNGLDDADLIVPVEDPERVGVLIGTGVGGFEIADQNLTIYRTKGFNRVNPFAMTAFLPNMPSHHVSLLAGSLGPISTVNAACATGTQAFGEGFELIRRGSADTVITGGAEGLIHEAAIAGFARMLALSTAYNDEPERASRPFDKDRDGFVLSEGAGVVVLERLDKASGPRRTYLCRSSRPCFFFRCISCGCT